MKQSAPFFTWKVRTIATKFINSDGSSAKTICQPGLDKDGDNNDSNIVSLVITSNETVDNFLNLQLSDGTTSYQWLSIKIPALVSPNLWTFVDIFFSQDQKGVLLDANGNPFFKLAKGWSVTANFNTAIATNKQANLIAVLEDF